ncbi:MAG: peptide-methionine (S)-S-oxide reductase MsrA [Betaproteobacteria bacterium]|nr:peptide-methionine (S)-S-oxide reductase MsrA [Betaproteobacteria bacterium]
MHETTITQKVTLAGGCFWCTEAAFEQLAGVISVLPGYMGGQGPQPTYESVCSGASGHAEVVQVEFDPAVIDFETLLAAFFTIHDPTTLNRQGHDTGTQYRSAIFFHNADQQAVAQAVIARLNGEGIWGAPIVTEITPASTFFVAEDYHHQYFRRNPEQGYCVAVVAPKAKKLRQVFGNHLKMP